MAITIYEQNQGGLIATGERSVTTFASGLCRVDRVYVCASSAAATHRQTLSIGAELPDDDSAPAVDGLYIFPAPQESKRGDGFTEFRVSAYGRNTLSTPDLVMMPDRMQIPDCNFAVWKVSGSVCVPSETTFGIRDLGIAYDDDFLFPFDAYMPFAPDRKFLGVTETSIVIPRLIQKQVTVDNGTTYFVQGVEKQPPGTRTYGVQMTLDGTTVDTTIPITLRDPEIKYTGYQCYGKFMEITFESFRAIYQPPT